MASTAVFPALSNSALHEDVAPMTPATASSALNTSDVPENVSSEEAVTATSLALNKSDVPENVSLEDAVTANSRVLGTTELLENILTFLAMDDLTRARQVSRLFRTVISTSKPLRNPMFRVFGSAELLEHILLQGMSLQELVRVQRVCHSFKTVIGASKSLRRAMFLDPAPVGETMTILTEAMLWEPSSPPLYPVVLTKFHPLIRELEQDSFDFPLPEQFFADNFGSFLSLNPGSWRPMLICQPPCEKFTLHCNDANGKQVLWVVQGNTLGALVDEMDRVLPELGDRPEQTTQSSWLFTRFYGLTVRGFIDEDSGIVKKNRLVPAKRAEKEAEHRRIFADRAAEEEEKWAKAVQARILRDSRRW